jgi:hypothetical protein
VEFEEEFENDVVALSFDNSTSTIAGEYNDFIDKYGTSYANRIVVGGRAKKLKWLPSLTTTTLNSD